MPGIVPMEQQDKWHTWHLSTGNLYSLDEVDELYKAIAASQPDRGPHASHRDSVPLSSPWSNVSRLAVLPLLRSQVQQMV